MLSERLSAWFGTDNGSAAGVVKDVLSGKERILPLRDIHRYPCRTLSACHFAGLNFVRVGFKHMQRTRGSSSPGLVRWLSAITEHRVLEETLGPCEQLNGQQSIQLDEMYRIPLFEGAMHHVATKHGPPSMILLKQTLRQMQLHASPMSAMVVSRNSSSTVCLKLREGSKNVFLVLDFALGPPDHSNQQSTTLALVISTSLEQTAARLSGNLPVDNHLVTRDRQWQAQLFASCTICMFTPAEGVVLLPDAESSVINDSVALLKVVGEIGDRDRDLERERDRNRRQNNQSSGSAQRESWDNTTIDAGMLVSTPIRRYASRVSGGSLQRSSTRIPLKTLISDEHSKRHCRIFLRDELPASTYTRPSPTSISTPSETSDEEACFECVICFENIPEEVGIQLLPCAHGFCRECLTGHVCSKIDERKFPVFCPLCMAERENTSPSVVSGDLVQRLGVPDAQYMRWCELEMAHICVRIHCRRCNRSAPVDKEDYEQLEEVSCPFPGCKHTWCKKCQQSLSGEGPKHSCDGTEELDYLVRQMGWKYCPKCRTPVQKNGGCNHMTCASPGCNTHFCYRCGKQITRASIPFLVRSAVNAHFKQCTL